MKKLKDFLSVYCIIIKSKTIKHLKTLTKFSVCLKNNTVNIEINKV